MKRDEVFERINSEFDSFIGGLTKKPKMEIIWSWCKIGFYTAIKELVESIARGEIEEGGELVDALGRTDETVSILDKMFEFYIGSEYCVLDSQEQGLALLEEYVETYL